MKPSNVQNYRPLRSDEGAVLNKQENLASFCQSTTIDSNSIHYNRLSTPVTALKTRGLHIDGARALGAHNVPISLIAQGKMWDLVDAKVRMVRPMAPSRKFPQKSSPVRHARALTVARTQQ